MKKIIIAFIALAIIVLTGCEKHDGKLYFKQVCNAECEGKKYIDQCPLTYIFAPTVTPYLHEWEEYGLEFVTNLCEKREGATVIRIRLYMHCPDLNDAVGRRFEFTFNESNGDTWYEYYKYCQENGINIGEIYAPTLDLESGIVKSGWFVIDSKDKNNICRGSFEMTTCDDITIAGTFANITLPIYQ